LEQLEGDKEMRGHVNLYKGDATKKASQARINSSKMDTRSEANGEGADDEDDDDEEKINLSELLDEMMLSGTATMKAEDVTGDSILTADQAAETPAIHLATTGFEAADFATTDFKFT
jgi:hypothetical protein